VQISRVMGIGHALYLSAVVSRTWRYGDSVDNTVEENSSIFYLLNAPVAASKGMRGR